jgi:predicted neutral ceramidase superfamily lipid hydrolase
MLCYVTVQTKAKALFYLTVPVIGATLLLAYVLATILHDVCVVCFSIYICNFAVLLLSYRAAYSSQIKKKAG